MSWEACRLTPSRFHFLSFSPDQLKQLFINFFIYLSRFKSFIEQQCWHAVTISYILERYYVSSVISTHYDCWVFLCSHIWGWSRLWPEKDMLHSWNKPRSCCCMCFLLFCCFTSIVLMQLQYFVISFMSILYLCFSVLVDFSDNVSGRQYKSKKCWFSYSHFMLKPGPLFLSLEQANKKKDF